MHFQNLDQSGEEIIPLEPELDLKRRGYEVIENGIRPLVIILHKLGFKLVCSCAGHTSFLPYPWLSFIYQKEQDGTKLSRLIELLSAFNKAQGKNGGMPCSSDVWVFEPITVMRKVSIHLHPAELNPGADPEKILALHKKAAELAVFIEINF